MNSLYLLFVSYIAFAGSSIPTGTYSGLSESQSTVAFELKKNGQAVVTTDFYDGEGDQTKKIDKKVRGTWSFKKPTLTLTFGKYEVQLRQKNDCIESRPCFVFEKSESKEKSPLEVEYEFVNWASKPPGKSTNSSTK